MNDTETWARELLEKAGGTVAAGPSPAHLTAPPRRNWLPAAAAAAVALLLCTSWVVRDRIGSEPPVSRPAASQVIPLVFGMTGDQARRTLEDAGLTVHMRLEQTCAEVEGRVIATEPPQGALRRGDDVTLTVSGPKDFICPGPDHREIAWQLIDLATGRGPGPELAEGAHCCSAAMLEQLANAATRFLPLNGVPRDMAPQLFVREVVRYGGPDAFDVSVGQLSGGRVHPLVTIEVEVGNQLFPPAGKVVRIRSIPPDSYTPDETTATP